MTKMRQWTILTALAVIIVFAAGWLLLVKPQKSKATDLRTQATTQQQQNQVLQSQIAQLQQEESSLPQQQAALRKFTTQVPDNASEPTIIRQLSAAANGAGVDLISMTPGTAAPAGAAATAAGTTSLTAPAATSGALYALPISIGITGSFPNVESFFQSLEKLPRALLVNSWSMCPLVTATTSGGSGGSGGAACTPPTVPQNKSANLPTDTLGGTLSATIFYAPPAGTAAPGTTSLTGTTPTTTTTPAPTTATTPAPTTSTPAASATTGGSTPPAS